MNGISVLKRIRDNKKTQNIQVLMLTGSRDSDDINKAASYDVKDYILKPPKREDLVNRVERILGAKQQFHEVLIDENERRAKGTLEIQCFATSISKKGMICKSNVALPEGYSTQYLNLPLLDEIGITTRDFKISHPNELEDGMHQFHISFISLPDKDLEALNE